MASNNTTFVALTTGTRDKRTDKGAVYFLDGNTVDGRLNLSEGTTLQLGDNTRINVNGNPGHTYMNGLITGKGLVYIGEPTTGGRLDFSSPLGAFQIENMTYVFLGDGDVFNHLENESNVFNGSLQLFIDMLAGNAYLQFASREYANVTLDIATSNLATVALYAARSSEDYTSFSKFRTKNINTLIMRAGSLATSHGRIYDPVYEGVTNNLISLKTERDTGGFTAANETKEYFTLDVTAIQNDNTRLWIKDSLTVVQFNDFITVANTTLKDANNTPLVAYNNKNVIPVLVRSVSTTQSTTRNTITYKMRRAGFKEIKTDNANINNPVVITEMLVDDNYTNTPIGTSISTANELMDNYLRAIVDNMLLDFDILSANGDIIIIKQQWTLTQDTTQTDLIVFDDTAKTISFKMDPAGLTATDKYKKFDGVVDATLDGNTDMLYRETTGNVRIRVDNMNPEAFDLPNIYVLHRVVGDATWIPTAATVTTNISMSISVLPNTDYEISLRVPGYTWRTFTQNSDDYGVIIDSNLEAVRDLANIALFSKTANQGIINTFSFDLATRRIIELNNTNDLLVVPFLEAYIGTQLALHNPVNIVSIDDPMLPNPTRTGFILPDNADVPLVDALNPITFKLDDNSRANVFLDFTIKSADDKDVSNRFIPAERPDDIHYFMYFATSSYNLSIPYPTASENAIATKTEIQTDLDKLTAIQTTIDTNGVELKATDRALINDIPTEAEIDTKLATQTATLGNKVDVVDTVVDSIKVKTDNLPNNTTTELNTLKTDTGILKTDSNTLKADTVIIKNRVNNLPQG